MITDPLEQKIAAALDESGIRYRHETEGGQRLDFYLPDFDTYIEVKRFHSPRIAQQTETQDNIIVLQGVKSVELFIKLLQHGGYSKDARL